MCCLYTFGHAPSRGRASATVQLAILSISALSPSPNLGHRLEPVAMGDVVDSMLDLMRRLPPTRTEENVATLIDICPDYADDLLGSVDQPLLVCTDRATGRDYLACDYNRDGESHRYVYETHLYALWGFDWSHDRSPWSNEYDPPLEDGTVPSAKLRKLEISANEAFDTYREMYSYFYSTSLVY